MAMQSEDNMRYTRYNTWTLNEILREIDHQIVNHDSVPAELAQELCYRVYKGAKVEQPKPVDAAVLQSAVYVRAVPGEV